MNQKHLMPAARCVSTRQLVKKQDLSGHRYTVLDHKTVWLLSQSLAEEMTARTRQEWQAEPIEY